MPEQNQHYPALLGFASHALHLLLRLTTGEAHAELEGARTAAPRVVLRSACRVRNRKRRLSSCTRGVRNSRQRSGETDDRTREGSRTPSKSCSRKAHFLLCQLVASYARTWWQHSACLEQPSTRADGEGAWDLLVLTRRQRMTLHSCFQDSGLGFFRLLCGSVSGVNLGSGREAAGPKGSGSTLNPNPSSF